jgi:hypothetical protein
MGASGVRAAQSLSIDEGVVNVDPPSPAPLSCLLAVMAVPLHRRYQPEGRW